MDTVDDFGYALRQFFTTLRPYGQLPRLEINRGLRGDEKDRWLYTGVCAPDGGGTCTPASQYPRTSRPRERAQIVFAGAGPVLNTCSPECTCPAVQLAVPVVGEEHECLGEQRSGTGIAAVCGDDIRPTHSGDSVPGTVRSRGTHATSATAHYIPPPPRPPPGGAGGSSVVGTISGCPAALSDALTRGSITVSA